MAKSPEKTEGTPTPNKATPAAANPTQQKKVQDLVQIDESKAVTSYGNFCRVTGTPEELIIDFALNPQPMGTPTKPIIVDQRIILNFYTAKRMLAALNMSLQRHEATFGVLETDIQKRVRPSALAQAQPRPQAQS